MHLKQIICLLQELHVNKIRCKVSLSPQVEYCLLILNPFIGRMDHVVKGGYFLIRQVIEDTILQQMSCMGEQL
jgi:hypothetical protein